jgi:GAF domain-containing protein
VTTFADQAAIAIENVRLFDQVQARTQELEESLQHPLEAFGRRPPNSLRRLASSRHPKRFTEAVLWICALETRESADTMY